MTRDGEVEAVRDVTFHVEQGDVIGIVGESGSGKSITAKSILGLITAPGFIKSGQVLFQGQDLRHMPEAELRQIRGNRIAMIFQDPMTSLNPVITVGKQLIEVIQRHQRLNYKMARAQAIELFREVGIPHPDQRVDQYPHEFSGGMRQRVMIAMALSCKPDLLIADEPTTALDVTIQAQILMLMRRLRDIRNTSILLITHDLGVVAQICTRVVVMYGGMIMEEGGVEQIFEQPSHPYTQGLLRSIPRVREGERERLYSIEGTPPNLLHPPSGCPFMDRCPHAMDKCKELPPYFVPHEGQRSLCWLLSSDLKQHSVQIWDGGRESHGGER